MNQQGTDEVLVLQADADRYAGGFTDAYVADAWERAADGWVRGGYTLVSGDVRTAVRYVVDPSGEMRVMARRPGPAPGAAAAEGPKPAPTQHRLGRPLLGGYRPPLYQRLVHFGGLDDGFDDHEFDDDESVDDDDPFFFDGPDSWDAAATPEWARLTRAGVGVGGAQGGAAGIGCKSTKCRMHTGLAGARLAGVADPGTPSGTSTDTGSASFQSGHYDMVLKTVPTMEKTSR